MKETHKDLLEMILMITFFCYYFFSDSRRISLDYKMVYRSNRKIMIVNKILTEYYAVEIIQKSNNLLNYNVYPVIVNKGEVLYRDILNQDYIEFKQGEVYIKMKGSLCWRGVWEDRYYMGDEEYWYGELKELSDLYSDYIEPFCKDHLRKLNPTINE